MTRSTVSADGGRHVEASVTLTCAPAVSGTHPRAAAACVELRAARGDVAFLLDPASNDPMACTGQQEPLEVTAQGMWKDTPISVSRRYDNACVLRGVDTALLQF
ncbi:SSI family serine proteinase inhibitor [Streptomyces chartreusis]|uniref:SSI family serine proteinase inhibitor n=1 Tax=Streptomyces chartreusis TaxID=1969 RepID=UPI00399A71BB